jgi:DNA-binding response OmpR family regulator
MAVTILVVEDEVYILDMVASFLELEGYAVRRAADGAEALALLQGGGIDLLLTDNMLPRLRGVDLVAYLHAHPELAVPVIMMSAVRPVPVPPTVTFLPKPFDLDHLAGLVARLLARPAAPQ